MSGEATSKQLKRTVKNSAIYAVGSTLRRLAGFIMLPIYTRYLTPADYGTIELLTMAIEIVSILIGLRISQAMFRYYILADTDEEKNTIVSTVLITVIIGSCIGVALINVAATPISIAIFGNAEYSDELSIFSLTLLIQAVITACLSYLRAKQKPVLFVTINTLYLLVQIVFNIIFVVALKMHVLGVIYSALCSGAIIGLFLLFYTFRNVGIRFSHIAAKKLILFTMPLMFASVGMLYANFADKYLLRVFGSLADVGLYSLAMRVSTVVSLVFEAFNMSWSADRFEIIKQENARQVYNKMFCYMSGLLLVVGCLIGLFAQDLFWVMTAPEFYPAASIVPLLTAAAIIRNYTVYNNFGIILNEKTRYIAAGSWLKAACATVAYLLIIPVLGIYGAAIGILLGNAAELYLVEKHSRRLYDMQLDWKPVIHIASVAAACVSIGIVLPTNEAVGFLARVFLFISFSIVVFYLPFWSDNERIYISGLIKRPFVVLGNLCNVFIKLK